MSSLNKVMLLGRLGQDPELKTTQSNLSVANFSLATSFKSKDKPETTEWHKVVVFGKLAENVTKFVKKGDQLYVEGRLQTRSWEDKETHIKRFTTEIVADNAVFLGKKEVAAQQEPIKAEDVPF